MNPTPLEQLTELTADQRADLRWQWINSVEDLRAALEAIPAGADRSRLEATPEWAPACHRLGVWQEAAPLTAPRPRGGLGLTIPAAVRSRLAPGRPRFASALRLGEPAGAPVLPRAVNWSDRFPAVRNQGPRGTCVAFASIALREWVGGFSLRLSEQFCYWACKQLDGSPEAGTTLAMAATAFERMGVCPEARWPYSPHELAGNEGHHPPPPDAEQAALDHRLPGWRLLNAQDVRTLKETLAGTNGNPGCPVVIGVAVFSSSFHSARAYSTGEIALPFPAEAPVGGHAMCAVGYQNDPAVPGGGYFIVRNSWGAEWAAQNRHAPGHALIPYAYMAAFCFEAFTEPASRLTTPPGTHPLPLAAADPFAAFLDHRAAVAPATERREWLAYEDTQPQGNRLPEGSDVRVIRHPLRPREFRADTPANRELFLRQWCAWSETGANEIARALLAGLPAETQSRLEAARSGRERHLEALDTNLTAAVGQPFPHLREPWFVRFAPYEWEPKVQSARLIADLTDAWLERWEQQHRPAAARPWPSAIRELLRNVNGVRLYELTGLQGSVQVLVGWFTPLKLALADSQPALAWNRPDATLTALAREALNAWRAEAGRPAPQFTFCSFGLAGECDALPPAFGAVEASDRWEIGWAFDPQGVLVASLPDRFSDRLALRDFSDRLLPITFRARVARVKAIVDELRDDDYGGRITVELVRRRTAERHLTSTGERGGYRQSMILLAFLRLQEEAPGSYRVEKADKHDDLSRSGAKVGTVRIVRPAEGDGEHITLASVRKRWFRRHALRLLAMAVTGGVGLALAQWNEHLHLTSAQSFLLFLPLVYLGNLAGAWLNRRADRSAG